MPELELERSPAAVGSVRAPAGSADAATLPRAPLAAVITRCLSSSALIGCSSGYLRRICTARRAT